MNSHGTKHAVDRQQQEGAIVVPARPGPEDGSLEAYAVRCISLFLLLL